MIRKLKDGKAVGMDEIPNVAWKYGGGGERMEEWVEEICRKVWRGEGWTEGWKEGIIVPIVKKGQSVRVEEYRGVTLMPTMCKIYVGILGERLQ